MQPFGQLRNTENSCNFREYLLIIMVMEARKQVLISALKDPDPTVKHAAAEALEKLELRTKFPALERLIGSGEKIEKLRAIYALAGMRGPSVSTLLARALKDDIEDVRAAAVRTLADLSDRAVLPQLVEALKDPSVIVEREVIDALMRFTEPQLVGPYIHMLKSKDTGVIERAIDALAVYGDKKAEEAMVFYATKGTVSMKCKAIRALGMMEP